MHKTSGAQCFLFMAPWTNCRMNLSWSMNRQRPLLALLASVEVVFSYVFLFLFAAVFSWTQLALRSPLFHRQHLHLQAATKRVWPFFCSACSLRGDPRVVDLCPTDLCLFGPEAHSVSCFVIFNLVKVHVRS